MARIFWKTTQKQAIAEESLLILQDPAYNGTNLEAIRRAMVKVLPPSLHRKLHGMEEVKWVLPLWEDLRKAAKAADVPQQQAVKGVPHPDERTTVKPLNLAEVPFDALWQELGRRLGSVMNPSHIRAQIRAETNATIDRRMPGIVPADPYEDVPKPEPIVRKPKVAVIGLTNGQAELLKGAYRGKLDMMFYDGSEGRRFVKGIASQVDLCIQSRWCKSPLGSTKDFENFQATTGGLDSIRSIINRTFNVEPVGRA